MDRHFVIIYDNRRNRLLAEKEYPDFRSALHARFEAEWESRHDRHLEIVDLHANSPETIRRTHGRYFRGAANPTPEYLTPTPPVGA